MPKLARGFTLPLLSVTLLSFAVQAQQERAANLLPLTERTNGEVTLKAFEQTSKKTQLSTVSLRKPDRGLVALAAVIGEDGLLLSKLSELKAIEVSIEELVVRDARFKRGGVQMLASDAEADLALLKTDLSDLKPVTWISAEKEPQLADWTYTHTSRLRTIFNGNISSNTRPITSSGAVLGVALKADKKAGGKPRVRKISPGSAADLGGVLKGDYIVGINNTRIENLESLQKAMRELVPGTIATIMVERDSITYQTVVELGFRSVLEQASSGNARISGLVSTRQSGFGRIYQHTAMLTPPMMGSPAFNVDGECIGINIARFDRTAILTLTPEQVLLAVARMAETSPELLPLKETLVKKGWQKVLDEQAKQQEEEEAMAEAKEDFEAADAQEAKSGE